MGWAPILIMLSAGSTPAGQGSLADGFIADTIAVAQDRCERPSHVQPPVPGSFAEHAESAWPILVESWGRVNPLDPQLVAKIIDGLERTDSLPAQWRRELTDTRSAASQVRRASHAERGGIADGFFPASMFGPAPDRMIAAGHLGRLLAIEMWTSLEAGEVTLRQERAFGQLFMRDVLGEWVEERLPPSFHTPPRVSSDGLELLRGRWFGNLFWIAHAWLFQELIEGLALRPEEFERRMEGTIELVDSVRAFAGALSSGPSWIDYLRTLRAGLARLEIFRLEVAAQEYRARRGHWPPNWEEMQIRDAIDPRSGKPIELRPDGLVLMLKPASDPPRTAESLVRVLQADVRKP